MISELDYSGNGMINYSDFLAATLDAKSFINEDSLKSVFKMFDTTGWGKISESDMHFAFQKLGLEVPTDEIHQLMV